MRKKLFWGIDLGSCKISLTAIYPESKRIFFSKCYDISFIEDGVIKDFYGLVEFLHKIFSEVKIHHNVNIINIVCAIKTRNITTHKNSFAFALTSERERVITIRDIDYLTEQAILLGQEWDSKVIFKEAEYFIVDNSQKVKNPVGLWGRKLSGEVLSLNSPYSFYENLNKVFQYLGVKLVGIVSSALCSLISSSILEKNFLFLDIGYEFTEVLIYRDSVLVDRWIVNFGSSLLNRVISEQFEIPLNLSQKIREDFIDLSAGDNEEILIKIENNYVNLDAQAIVSTIKEVCNSFISELKEECKRRGYIQIFKENIYITGGFSLIKGVEEFFVYLTGPHTSIISPPPSIENRVSYVRALSSLGAAIYCEKLCRNSEYAGMKRFFHLIRSLYTEYF